MADEKRVSDEVEDGLDENGKPKISKNAAKKAAAKAEKASKKAENKANAPPKPVKEAPRVQPIMSVDEDPMEATCEVGWLKEVYNVNRAGTGVTTRFPPEPNGFLHIGHAKAIAVNFGFAKHYGGKCYLRYDDTNPVKEEEEYFDAIRVIVEWLGYEPFKITYSSDHFGELYSLAETLIRKDKAYVCHCSADEIKAQKGGDDNKTRGARFACAHRDRPVGESLEEFKGMRDGKFKPKEAILRMKQALIESNNPYMWDLPAYRIPEPSEEQKQAGLSFARHPRTGDSWPIYPTYDFTHCLCDAFEEITHSLCTTEFRTARESYDWLVDELRDKLPAKPQQREFGRLRVTGTLLSKRKIQQLVAGKYVRGWDDPRLYTLFALRRRGVPPGAIRAFVAELGVSDALTLIQIVRLETVVRRYLERSVPRLMLIPDPVPVIIDNLPEDHVEEISLEFMRGDSSMGSHVVPFTRTVYIDRSDFRAADDPNFFRLAPGKTVGLLNVAHPIRATSFSTDTAGRVTEIRATYETGVDMAAARPKAFIQWVALSPQHKSPVKAEVRFFNPLFRSDDPDAHPGGFLQDVNPDSEEVFPNALVECGFDEIRRGAPWPKDHVKKTHPGPWDVRFQGVRVAYFALDTESTEEKIVLNKIVGLKEDSSKAA